MTIDKIEKAKNLKDDLEHLKKVIGLIEYFNMEYPVGKYHKKRTLSKTKSFMTSSISFKKNLIGVHQYNDKHWYNTQIDVSQVNDPKVRAEYVQARHDIMEFMIKRLNTVYNNTERRLELLWK